MDAIPKITNKHDFNFVRTDLLSIATLNPFALLSIQSRSSFKLRGKAASFRIATVPTRISLRRI